MPLFRFLRSCDFTPQIHFFAICDLAGSPSQLCVPTIEFSIENKCLNHRHRPGIKNAELGPKLGPEPEPELGPELPTTA